jgi:hypothetical protein
VEEWVVNVERVEVRMGGGRWPWREEKWKCDSSGRRRRILSATNRKGRECEQDIYRPGERNRDFPAY